MKTKITSNLYKVETIFKELNGDRNVFVEWFVVDRINTLMQCHINIENYGSDINYKVDVEMPLKELFLYKEASALKAYLWVTYGGSELKHFTQLLRVNTPLTQNMINKLNIPTEKDNLECFELFKDEKYDLPFKVVGYYDLRKTVKDIDMHIGTGWITDFEVDKNSLTIRREGK